MPLTDTKPLTAYLEKHTINSYGSSKTIMFAVSPLGYKLSKDVIEHPYWEVDTSSFHEDVMDEFNKGNLILNHAIHNVSIVMPMDRFEKYLYHPQTVVFTDFNDWCAIERKIEEKYVERSEKINATKVLSPGFIFTFGVADGQAMYIVTKVTKASVFFEHLHFGDGYRDMMVDSFDGKMPRKHFDRISFFGRDSLFGATRHSPFENTL